MVSRKRGRRIFGPALLLLPGILSCGSPRGETPDQAGPSKPGRVMITGTVLRRDSTPSAQTTVFLGLYRDSSVAFSYAIDMAKGETTGLANPHAKTDSSGQFRIEADAAWFDIQQRYALGAFDYSGNVVVVRTGGVIWTFSLDSSLAQVARRRGTTVGLGRVICPTCG
jgi:hypothetical protein